MYFEKNVSGVPAFKKSCGLAVHSLQFYVAHVRPYPWPFWRRAKNFVLFTGKPPWWKFLFYWKPGWSRMYLCNFIKIGFYHKFPYGTCKIAFFNILDIYLGEIFTIWIIKSKMTCLRKYIDLTFKHKDDTYCVKDNVYI